MKPGWFITFKQHDTKSVFLRFRWRRHNDAGKKATVYIGTLGADPTWPPVLLESIVSKVLRMDCKNETVEQQDKHLEMLFCLRDVDKTWEAWEQRWNDG
jgi:hypothetical protein